jgi:hypothetical protein
MKVFLVTCSTTRLKLFPELNNRRSKFSFSGPFWENVFWHLKMNTIKSQGHETHECRILWRKVWGWRRIQTWLQCLPLPRAAHKGAKNMLRVVAQLWRFHSEISVDSALWDHKNRGQNTQGPSSRQACILYCEFQQWRWVHNVGASLWSKISILCCSTSFRMTLQIYFCFCRMSYV